MTQLQKTASTCILRDAPVHGNFLFVVGSLERVGEFVGVILSTLNPVIDIKGSLNI